MKDILRNLFKDVWNVPNVLTMMRLVLVPVFIGQYMYGHTFWAMITFCIASLTDLLDGYIARKYDLVTNFGKLFDPLADKLLVLSCMVCHTVRGVFPWPAVAIVGAKELILVLGSALMLNRRVVVHSNIFGKAGMVAFVAALILGFFHREFTQLGVRVDLIVLWISVGLSLVALVMYVVPSVRQYLEAGNRQDKPAKTEKNA